MRDYRVYDFWRNHVQTSDYGPRLHLSPHPVPRPGLFLKSLFTVVGRFKTVRAICNVAISLKRSRCSLSL